MVPPTIGVPTLTPPVALLVTADLTVPPQPTELPSIFATETASPSAMPTGTGSLPVVPGLAIEPGNVSQLIFLAGIPLEGGQVSWSPDGLLLAVGTRTTVVIFAPLSEAGARVFTASEGWDNPSPSFGSVAFSADGTQVAGGFTVIVAVWDVPTGSLIHEHHNVSGEVTSVAYSPNGLWIAASGMRGGFVSRSTTTRPSFWIDSAPEVTWSVAFSSDSRTLASTGGTSIRIWDPSTGALLRAFSGAGFQLAFSPDGTILAGGNDLWDPITGKLLRTLELEPAVHPISLAFHPSGAIIALASDNGSITFFDQETGELLHTIAAHEGRVRGLAFSPDGTLLASTGSDDIVRIWGIPSQP
jgi:WD40 repeat protein